VRTEFASKAMDVWCPTLAVPTGPVAADHYAAGRSFGGGGADIPPEVKGRRFSEESPIGPFNVNA
jgi:hypothetical protein